MGVGRHIVIYSGHNIDPQSETLSFENSDIDIFGGFEKL